ncbi:sodium-dependent proline transporter-like [Haemaphysalis longicornis]
MGTQPFLSLAALWIFVFVVARRGFLKVKNFLYITLSLHVATTAMLFFRAATLDGSSKGFGVMRRSDWSHIFSAEMWAQALYTSLESVGVAGMVYLGVEKFNFFKNNFEEDVLFVVVADVATKAIGTAMAYLFLGYLSTSTGIDIGMLIDPKSNYVVSIMPQALTLVPFPEFWGRVHLIWLASSLLPKFLIIPEIVVETLSTSHPFLLEHPGTMYLLICGCMFFFSTAVCSPGGASVVSVLVHTQGQSFRFLMIALECLVFLQFYGVRRLSIEAKMITKREPNLVLKFCWASLAPVAIIVLQWLEGMYGAHHYRDYPWWLWAVIAWFEFVELSFIPVYAIVFLVCTDNMRVRKCAVAGELKSIGTATGPPAILAAWRWNSSRWLSINLGGLSVVDVKCRCCTAEDAATNGDDDPDQDNTAITSS